MKQSIIDSMQKYQITPSVIKAVKYEEGMEDCWLIKYGDDCISEIFNNKKSAEKYIEEHANEDKNFYYGSFCYVMPVFLREITRVYYEESYIEDYGCHMVDAFECDGKLYEYNEIRNYEDGIWLVYQENDWVPEYISDDDFRKKYEKFTHTWYDAKLCYPMENIELIIMDGFGVERDHIIWTGSAYYTHQKCSSGGYNGVAVNKELIQKWRYA